MSNVKSLPDLAARLALVCLLIGLCSSPAGSRCRRRFGRSRQSAENDRFPQRPGCFPLARDRGRTVVLRPLHRRAADAAPRTSGDRHGPRLPCGSRLKRRRSDSACPACSQRAGQAGGSLQRLWPADRPGAGKAVVRFSRLDSPGAPSINSRSHQAPSPHRVRRRSSRAGLSIEVAAEGDRSRCNWTGWFGRRARRRYRFPSIQSGGPGRWSRPSVPRTCARPWSTR